MSTYVYKASKTGVVLEQEYPIGRAPKVIVRRGVRYRKQVTTFTAAAATKPRQRDHHFRAVSQPPWWPHAPRHDPKDGTPLYSGIKEVNEAKAKANAAGEQVDYD